MDDTLRAIAYRALPLGHLPQLRYRPGGRYAECEGVRLIDWGEGASAGNAAVALSEAPRLARVLALADDFFAGRPGGYGVRVDSDANSPLEAELRGRGWCGVDDHPAMVLHPIPVVPPPLEGLAIRRVTDAAGLEQWYEAASPGARGPTDPPAVDYNRIFMPSLAAALDPETALFTGFVGDRPVASSALYAVEGIAEIGAVATWPDVRRRGFGAAMTWAAVAEGAARNCTAAALRSSAMAVPVYAGMGFVYVCTFRTYRPPA